MVRRFSSHIKRNNFGANLPLRENKLPYRDGQLESPWPRTSRIEIEHAPACLLLRYVAMPRDHDLESGYFWLEVKLRQVMKNVYGNACEFDGFSLRQCASPCAFVDITADGGDWRHFRELFQDVGVTNVSGMNDVLGATQGVHGLRTEQSVRVGDDADQDSGPHFFRVVIPRRARNLFFLLPGGRSLASIKLGFGMTLRKADMPSYFPFIFS
mgnify:CR=1 FL=1